MTYTELMRNDSGLNRTQFGKKYNIPLRTLENWEKEVTDAPEYVIDLLGRVVYADLTGRKPSFYVVAIGKHDEWNRGHFESYIEAIKAAREELERATSEELEVEIRLYEENIEDEDCENFNFETVSF
jgi:putative transcriptional regulator